MSKSLLDTPIDELDCCNSLCSTRSTLVEALQRIAELERENAVLRAGVFAAGDMVDDSRHHWPTDEERSAWEAALAVAKGEQP